MCVSRGAANYTGTTRLVQCLSTAVQGLAGTRTGESDPALNSVLARSVVGGSCVLSHALHEQLGSNSSVPG